MSEMDSDHKLWLGIVACITILIVVCILSITVYEVSELHWIKPQIIQRYTWPQGSLN